MAKQIQAEQLSAGSDTMALVATASRAQADKVRAVLERIDQVAQLDPDRVRGIVDMIEASSADGGCGIGCW